MHLTGVPHALAGESNEKVTAFETQGKMALIVEYGNMEGQVESIFGLARVPDKF